MPPGLTKDHSWPRSQERHQHDQLAFMLCPAASDLSARYAAHTSCCYNRLSIIWDMHLATCGAICSWLQLRENVSLAKSSDDAVAEFKDDNAGLDLTDARANVLRLIIYEFIPCPGQL